MEQNGIPFKGPVREIVAQASHISDSGHILPVPVLDYGHETGDVSFYRAFIQNVSLGKTVMGKSGRIIGNHDRDGTLVSNIPINPLVRQSAAHHAFLGGTSSAVVSVSVSVSAGTLSGMVSPVTEGTSSGVVSLFPQPARSIAVESPSKSSTLSFFI